MKRFNQTLVLFFLLGILVGCGQNVNKRPSGSGKISGVVTFKEKTVANATVTFVNSDGVQKTGKTDDSGTYTMGSLSAGPYMVGIVAGNPRDLPLIYSSPSDSGLVFTVLPGDNQANFNL